MNLTTALAICGLLGAFLGSLLTLLLATYAFKWRHLGKTWTITLPEIAGTLATIERKALKGGFFQRVSNDPNAEKGDKDLVVPSGPAAYPTNLGPLQILSSSGFSLVAPSKLEAAKVIEHVAVAEWITKNKKLPAANEPTFLEGLTKAVQDAKQMATRFLIHDPLTYRKFSRESVMQKLYQSTGKGNEPWYAKAALIGIIFVGFIVLIVAGVLVMKVLPALQAAQASGA